MQPITSPTTVDLAPRPPDGPSVVAVGGGTGLPIVLEGLRQALGDGAVRSRTDRDRLTAIVTVADDASAILEVFAQPRWPIEGS